MGCILLKPSIYCLTLKNSFCAHKNAQKSIVFSNTSNSKKVSPKQEYFTKNKMLYNNSSIRSQVSVYVSMPYKIDSPKVTGKGTFLKKSWKWLPDQQRNNFIQHSN